MKKIIFIIFLVLQFFLITQVVSAAPIPPKRICKGTISGVLIELDEGHQYCEGNYNLWDCRLGVLNLIPCSGGATCQYNGSSSNEAICSCPNGKLNINGVCDPACCSNDAECSANSPQPQTCSIPNGFCQSGTSCSDPSTSKPIFDNVDTSSILNNVSGCGGKNLPCCDPSNALSLRLNQSLFDSLPSPFDFIVHHSIIPAINAVADSTVNRITPLISDLIMKRMLGIDPANKCNAGYTENLTKNPGKCICTPSEVSIFKVLCSRITSTDEQTACSNCIKDGGGIWSGIGCLSTDIPTLVKDKILGVGLGFAGMFALLCIIYAAFRLQTSQGNPEKIKKAQELLTSCIMGLMLIIFSVFILRLIGVDILKIPGFN